MHVKISNVSALSFAFFHPATGTYFIAKKKKKKRGRVEAFFFYETNACASSCPFLFTFHVGSSVPFLREMTQNNPQG